MSKPDSVTQHRTPDGLRRSAGVRPLAPNLPCGLVLKGSVLEACAACRCRPRHSFAGKPCWRRACGLANRAWRRNCRVRQGEARGPRRERPRSLVPMMTHRGKGHAAAGRAEQRVRTVLQIDVEATRIPDLDRRKATDGRGSAPCGASCRSSRGADRSQRRILPSVEGACTTLSRAIAVGPRA